MVDSMCTTVEIHQQIFDTTDGFKYGERQLGNIWRYFLGTNTTVRREMGVTGSIVWTLALHDPETQRSARNLVYLKYGLWENKYSDHIDWNFSVKCCTHWITLITQNMAHNFKNQTYVRSY